jgi:hypothetical protein
MTTENRLYEEKVWDRSIRIFHWVNVLCVLALMIIGSTILYANLLGISSEGKITLKIMHAYVGYVFAFNLLWRLVWGFLGNRGWRRSQSIGGVGARRQGNAGSGRLRSHASVPRTIYLYPQVIFLGDAGGCVSACTGGGG